jgi:uncharacterized protein YjdB
MKTIRTLSVCVVILLTTLSLPVSAQFSGSGSGSSSDPFIITNADELNQVRNFLNNGNVYFKMLNDIDLTQWLAENNPTQGWNPIGNSSSNAFRGNFNGNKCKIIGLNINRSTTDYVGLFGYLISGANITDLTLRQCKVSGRDYTGILAGYSNQQAVLKNISIQGDLRGNNYVGIMVGYTFNSGNSEINNATIHGNVIGNNYVGLFAGFIEQNITTSNIYYNITVSIDVVNLQGSLVGQTNVGGLAGGIKCYSNKTTCYYNNVCDVINKSNAAISFSNISMEGTVAGQAQTGGIVGDINSLGSGYGTALINSSKLLFKGKVTGKDNTGGFYGNCKNGRYSYINIRNSGFWGDVIGSNSVGGIVGQLSNTNYGHTFGIYNCSASGNVTGLTGCGGILGNTVVDGYSEAFYINNCHSHCDVLGTISVGGIVGKGHYPNLINNYSTGRNIRGISNVGGIIGESTIEDGFFDYLVHSNVSINNIISGGSSVGRIIGKTNDVETLTSAQSNYGWALTKVIVNNISTIVTDSYQHGITYGLSQFKKKATYQGIGWDFTTADFWSIVENQSFPYFTWQTPPTFITTSPIKAGTTTINGTSVANVTINVTVGGKEYTTIASSMNWSVEVDPMLGGDQILVIAKQDGLAWSYAVRGIIEFQGSGTLADPYKIYTVRDLKAIESNIFANYKLMNDLDLTSWIQTNSPNSGWTGIGTIEASLMGSFDGDNHKITGFWQNSSQKSCGLFSSVSTDGSVRNLIIEPATDKTISGLDYSAIMAGYNYGTIENCKVNGKVQGYNVGCIAGFNSGTIKNCIGKGLITSIVSSGKAGGIVGENTGLISNCEYTGDITCNIGNGYVGGIAGSSSNSIVNCYYSGTLSSSIATAHIGGIVGLNSGLISTSYSLGTINATGATAYAGGIAGDNNSTTSEINNSESGMNINSTGASTVCGGVVGITKGKVINCYASGTITSGYRGSGVVGYMDGTGAKVLGCVGLNTNISGKNSVCRVLGGVMNSAIAPSTTDNYGCKDMLITINGVVQPAPTENYLQGTTKERNDLKKQSFYEGIGWNFISIWNIIEGVDYPYLRFLFKPVTSVSLNKSATTLNVGSNETLTPTVTPTDATNKNVTWSSSNNSVATVDALGIVTALSAGTATITVATIDQNKTAQCIVTIVNQVTSVSLNKSQITLNVGSFETLTATVSPADATNKNVTWSSSNNSVATVDATGKVTALSSGSSTITVTTTDQSKTAQCVVTVILLPETAGTITGLTTVCQGQNTVIYTVPVINNATSYIWTLPDGATGTSTTNSISVNYGNSAVSGNITVKGHNSFGDGAISTLAITVNATPAAPIVGTITQPTCALASGSVVLSGLPATGTWTLTRNPGGTATTGTGTSSTISLLAPGTYTFTLTNSSGCISAASANVVINDQPLMPKQPIISLNTNVLHSDALTGNQWYNKNGLIAGATYQDYTPISSGNYYVVVSINGCTSNPSNSIYFIPTSTDAIEVAKSIKIYPNPVTNELTIEFEGNTVETEFNVVNSIGQVVSSGIILEKTVVKTESFAPGIYLVRIKSGNTFEFRKVIKN